MVILSLEYKYLITSTKARFESSTGLWQQINSITRNLIPYNILSDYNKEDIRVLDNINKLRDAVTALNYNGLSDDNHIKLVEPQLNNQVITISINGNETFVNNSRTEILRAYKSVGSKRLSLATGELKLIDANFLQRLQSIATRYNVEIMLSDEDTDFKGNSSIGENHFIYLLGNGDNLNFAENDVKVLCDTLVRGYFVDNMQLPLSMIPCLGGVNLANFSEIVFGLNVNIYLPHMMPNLFSYSLLQSNDNMTIWITSKEVPEMVNTKRVLRDLMSIVDPRANTQARLFVQEIQLPKEKLDLIALYNQQDIASIMCKHGTFVQIPGLGEPRNNTIIIQGQTADCVNETALEISELSSTFYEMHIRFLRGPSSTDLEYYLLNLMASKKLCILTYNEHGMCILGSKNEMHLLLDVLVSDLKSRLFFTKIVQEAEAEIKINLSMEVANDQRDFLSGKKNGKIIKILNRLNHMPEISFKSLNEYNFMVNMEFLVSQPSHSEESACIFDLVLRTLHLIELELPAEMQFNIPEVFHKSIIGNGGSIVQTIMKKYNVFIKFSSASHNRPGKENDAEKILYLFRRKNNVLIKCPMKNQKSIMSVKNEIDLLVSQCENNSLCAANCFSVAYNTVEFRLLKCHYLNLIKKYNYNLNFVLELETEFNTYVAYPNSIELFQNGNDCKVTIKGNDAKARLCADKLSSLLPHTQEIRVSPLHEATKLVDDRNDRFRDEVIIPLRLLLGVELMVETTGNSRQVLMSSFDRLRLREAKDSTVRYLKKHGISSVTSHLEFDPVLSVHEQLSPSRPSSQRRAVSKSPVRQSGKLNTKAATKNDSTQPSPTRGPKKPLGVITNQVKSANLSSGLKSIPNLHKASPFHLKT